MKKKYLINSSEKKARLARLAAKAIDLFLALLPVALFSSSGTLLLSSIYFAISDSFPHGQSVGKRFIGLRVISLENGQACSISQSIIRNLPISIPLFLGASPIWGSIIALVIGTPLILLETYLIFKLDSSNRLGDVMADTTVMASNGPQAKIANNKEKGWFEPNAPT